MSTSVCNSVHFPVHVCYEHVYSSNIHFLQRSYGKIICLSDFNESITQFKRLEASSLASDISVVFDLFLFYCFDVRLDTIQSNSRTMRIIVVVNLERFQDKIVLVTGAGRGIGKMIAVWFAREGAQLAVNDIQNAELDDTASMLRGFGNRVETYVCDISNGKGVEELVHSVIRDFARIDILVNNAGIALPTPTLDLSEEEWDRVLNVNLKGTFFVSRAVLKQMKSQRSGRVIMIASIAGKTGGVYTGIHYDVSKAGIIVMTRRLAREFGEFGVTVNAVAPSFAETNMLKDLALDSPKMKAESANLNVIKRLATPEDVANAVLFLASDSSSFITGETLNVNGGRLMD